MHPRLINRDVKYVPKHALMARQAVGDTWDKAPEQAPLRLLALKRIFKFYVRASRACPKCSEGGPVHAWQALRQVPSVLWGWVPIVPWTASAALFKRDIS